MLLEQVRAVAFLCCTLFVAGTAQAASRLDGPERPEARVGPRSEAVAQADGTRWASFDWPDGDAWGEATSRRTPTSADAGESDPMMFAVLPGRALPSLNPARSNTAVPLPEGLTLFGSGILTLGLMGLFSHAQRRAFLEGRGFADIHHGPGHRPAEATLPVPFKIEVRGERGFQVRHALSARVTIDLIADLLNDGWEMVCIYDRNGSAIDYEEVVTICNQERRNL